MEGCVATSATVDFSDIQQRDSGTLKTKEEETYDAGVFERVEAEVLKLLKEPHELGSS